MNLYSPKTIRQLKDKYGFRFAKGLGQNFLTDPSVPEAMVRGSGIGPQDLVIEIGPGIGVLTAAAAEAAGRVVAIEVDGRLLPILGETLQEYENIEVICADVLKTDLAQLIDEQIRTYGLTGAVRVIGNLPYYITTPIIMKLLEEELPIDSITVMMQKEVADRIEAGPGSREYGAISLAVQYYCRVSRIISVPKEVFLPRPKVDSAVLLLELREEKAVRVKDEARLFTCIRAGFGQRRKTLVNSLSGAGNLPKETVREVLAAAGIEENRRAETLSIEEFAKIADELTSREGSSWKTEA
ncbi:MAG: 16S rRNA (adenine(1518)-N(6)/adenine(1519)-N(6))-dimethyltransferase RsmA [Firmicutes bacterium]|nr:16S rRNA (adenine(1518)-N(6)/adenine(1519)-N(6))-dimethyltransferase RsmA [Bacillota bacterium]